MNKAEKYLKEKKEAKQTEIKVVESSSPDEFTDTVNELLSLGYVISSTSCGFVNSEQYGFCGSYQAILINQKFKDDEQS